MAENCYYLLNALLQQPKKRGLWALDLDLILSRLNRMETHFGFEPSSWYGTDPGTGTHYLQTNFSWWPHLRITYPGAASRVYVRNRVDEIRAAAEIEPFEWRYTPDHQHVGEIGYESNAVDTRNLIEILQAIGRPYGGSGEIPRYVVHTIEDNNGTITEWDSQPSTEARAGFASVFRYNTLERARQAKSAEWGWQACRVPGIYQDVQGDLVVRYQYGGEEPVGGNLILTQWSSNYYDTITEEGGGPSGYDWVETEGAVHVRVLGGSGESGEISGTVSVSGKYTYNGHWEADYITDCAGGHAVYLGEGASITHSETEKLTDSDDIGGAGWVDFEPVYTVDGDGGVAPVLPTDLPVGTPETVEIFWEQVKDFLQQGIDGFGEHVTTEHLRNSYDATPHGICGNLQEGDVISSGGSSSLNGGGRVTGYSEFNSTYVRTGHLQVGGGWLYWLRPYLTGEWYEGLKAI